MWRAMSKVGECDVCIVEAQWKKMHIKNGRSRVDTRISRPPTHVRLAQIGRRLRMRYHLALRGGAVVPPMSINLHTLPAARRFQ
jgi:hypothetical protein